MQLGFPEARIPLAQATVLLATSPKSNSAYLSIDKALEELDNEYVGDIPSYLKGSGKYSNDGGEVYKYSHDYEKSLYKAAVFTRRN
jgi:putative ATPase